MAEKWKVISRYADVLGDAMVLPDPQDFLLLGTLFLFLSNIAGSPDDFFQVQIYYKILQDRVEFSNYLRLPQGKKLIYVYIYMYINMS